MIDFKKEEEKYQQIQLIKSVLADFRAYDVIRQAQIDLMYHFNIFFTPTQDVSLFDKISVKVNNPSIGYSKGYNEIAHLATGIVGSSYIKAEFTKEYAFRGIIFIIDDYLVATIPEEELTLLDLLGKIETTVTKAQPSTITK